MKKIMITIVLACSAMSFLQAQEYKVSKSSGKIEIREVNHIAVEGYSGSEIIFSSRNGSRAKDPRAQGLRSLSTNGLEDNTGLGLSVVEKAGTLEVQQLKKMDGPDIIIKVPKGVAISYAHSSPYGSDVEFKNVESEIEVSTLHNNVKLDNVTGPMTINTIHGDIDANIGASMKEPISIASVHGHVDVAIPVSTKANLKMKTVYGEIFVDPDFKIEIEKTGNMIKISDNVSGKLNGGGMELNFSSTHSNVYLRKKQ